MPKEIQLKPSITATKISDTEIEITKDIPKPEPVVQKYERSFIERQIVAIQSQKDAFDAQRDLEIADCQAILDQMDSLGVVAKPVKVQPNPVEIIQPADIIK